MSKVLIIEDEVAIADLEKDYLELSGFEVETENDGVVGLKRALSEDFDMYILDLMLPGIDGFEICKQIREEKNTPILMVSAKKDDIDKIRGLGLGADDYITKPFSPSELVARVKAHLARYERLIGSNTVENDVIEIRGIRIDKTARRVWVNGEEKQFTTKEFDLLTFLAEHPNHVFTKEELFREIWDMESIGDIATVTVHIKKIREKIETPARCASSPSPEPTPVHAAAPMYPPRDRSGWSSCSPARSSGMGYASSWCAASGLWTTCPRSGSRTTRSPICSPPRPCRPAGQCAACWMKMPPLSPVFSPWRSGSLPPWHSGIPAKEMWLSLKKACPPTACAVCAARYRPHAAGAAPASPERTVQAINMRWASPAETCAPWPRP